MHRSIDVSAPAPQIESIVMALKDHQYVTGLTRIQSGSLKPMGDTLMVTVLNRGADDVLRIVRQYTAGGTVSVVTAETASITSAANQKEINRDIDEAIWEEMETGLRLNGRLTSNFLLLMALGGVITAVGFASFVQMQVATFIAASIIAPGLEPIAKLPFGIVLKNRDIVWSGLLATAAGYLVLLLSSALTFALLLWAGEADSDKFLANEVTDSLLGVKWMDVMMSLSGAAASIIMYLSYRRQVIAGPLIALILIPATAAAGICAAIGKWKEAGEMMGKVAMEIGIIVVVGCLLISIKQKFLHKRKPLR